MFYKIVLIGILLMSVSTVYAWDEESGYAEGEEIGIVWEEGYDYFIYQTPEKTNWYDPLIDLWISISSYLFTDEEIEVTVTTTCLKWDGDSYEPDTDTLPEEYGMTLDIPANQTGTTNIKIDPVEEFFKNNTDAVDDFKTRDDDSEHPDILNVSLNITGAGLDVHEHGYTTLNDAALNNIDDVVNSPDYGFVTSGRGSDAGSGGIYTGLNIYGAGDDDGINKGMGDTSWAMFYMLIPLMFVLCVFKFIFNLMGY